MDNTLMDNTLMDPIEIKKIIPPNKCTRCSGEHYDYYCVYYNNQSLGNKLIL